MQWMQRTQRRGAVVPALVVAAFGLGVAAAAVLDQTPKRFGVVVPGELYRSGGPLSPGQVAWLHERHGITRIICLLNPEDRDAREAIFAERDAAVTRGIEWINIPMGGSGEHEPPQRKEVLALLTQPDPPPTLVHCAAGVNRAGLAIGLWRAETQGWTWEQIHAELLANDFEDLLKHETMRAALKEAAAD